MPTVRVEAHLSNQELLKAVKQLNSSELQEFVSEVLALRAQREASCLSSSETALLLQINQGLPDEIRRRDTKLIGKRRDETMTPSDHADLLALTDQVEQREVERLAALTELANLRRTSLTSLMKDLGLRPPAHDE